MSIWRESSRGLLIFKGRDFLPAFRYDTGPFAMLQADIELFYRSLDEGVFLSDGFLTRT